MPAHRSDDDSTPRTRELGMMLRHYRLSANVEAQAVARRIGMTPSQITRVEKGQRHLDDFNLATFLGMCNVGRDELAAVLALAHEPDGCRVQRHDGRLLDRLCTLIYLETNATGIDNYEPLVVPGLAQTEDYARALFHWGQGLRTQPVIEAHVDARMRRQKMLDRQIPPLLHLYVHENALRSVVGNPKIMYDQMISLMLLTAHPNYTIRVVRNGSCPQGGFGGPFMMMRYENHAPVVAVDGRTITLFLDEPEDICDHQFILDEVAKMSLTADESRELIDKLSSEYERMR